MELGSEYYGFMYNWLIYRLVKLNINYIFLCIIVYIDCMVVVFVQVYVGVGVGVSLFFDNYYSEQVNNKFYCCGKLGFMFFELNLGNQYSVLQGLIVQVILMFILNISVYFFLVLRSGSNVDGIWGWKRVILFG